MKPATFTNDLLAEVEPLGRLLFIGLWCHADRAGRVLDRGKKLKAEILPYDDCDVENLLQQLEMRGFIQRYAVDQVHCIQIVTFQKHQNPHKKEPASSLPPPPADGLVPVNTGLVPEIPAPSSPSSLTLNPSSLNGELESDAPPAGLHPLNYGRRLCEDLGMTVEGNVRVVASAVEAVMGKNECNGPAAYTFLLEKARKAEARGEKVDRWWFQDSKWKNVKAGEVPQVSASELTKKLLENG